MGSIILISLVGVVLISLVVVLSIRSIKSKAVSGKEGMMNEVGIAVDDFRDGKGRVRVHGEIWQAVSDLEIHKDDEVKIIEIQHLKVKVSPLPK